MNFQIKFEFLFLQFFGIISAANVQIAIPTNYHQIQQNNFGGISSTKFALEREFISANLSFLEKQQIFGILKGLKEKRRNGILQEFFKIPKEKRHQILKKLTKVSENELKIFLKEFEEIVFINGHSNGIWKASLHLPFAFIDELNKKFLYGLKPSKRTKIDKSDEIENGGILRRKKREIEAQNKFPDEFDARKKWPECEQIIQEITDQGKCASCWAVASAGVLSDRICIGKLKKLEKAIKTWKTAIEVIKKEIGEMVDWRIILDVWMRHLAGKNKQIFGIDDGEWGAMMERKIWHKIWFKKLMGKWKLENKIEIGKIGEKIGEFENWIGSMKWGKGGIGENEAKIMRKYWCQSIGRKMDENERNELRRIVKKGFGWEENEVEKGMREMRGQGFGLEMEMLGEKILTWEGNNGEGKYSMDELRCILQEFSAGMGEKELENEENGKERKMGKVIGKWQEYVEIMFGGNGKGEEEWERGMREMFEEEMKGPENVVSAMDLLTCAQKDGGEKCNGAGGEIGFEFAIEKGSMSGTNFERNSGCKPYKLTDYWGEKRERRNGLKCEEKCSNGNWGEGGKEKRQKGIGRKVRQLFVANYGDEGEFVGRIMGEIMRNGPVMGSVTESASFRKYGGGIYSKNDEIEKFDGRNRIDTDGQGHAIRLIGWGEKGGVKYWKAVNSWGREWGEEGTFQIARGQNELDIEDQIFFPVL